MKRIVVIACSVVVALIAVDSGPGKAPIGVTVADWGKGKAPIGKGKGKAPPPPLVTKGQGLPRAYDRRITEASVSGERDKKLVDLLEKHEAEIRRLIRSINVFVSADGGFAVTVYEENAGIDERSRIAPGLSLQGTRVPVPPILLEGAVILQVTLADT